MNIMGKYNTALICLFLIACNNSKKDISFIILSKEEKKEWTSDSLGCSGYRDKFISESFTKEKYLGLNSKVFFDNFGRPNHVQISKRNKRYIYWLECSVVPKVLNAYSNAYDNKEKINYEAKRLTIMVDNYDIIQEISIQLP